MAFRVGDSPARPFFSRRPYKLGLVSTLRMAFSHPTRPAARSGASAAHWQRWREDPAYQAVAPLRRVQQKMDEARFTKLRQFLREPRWEATNNGAERMGRSFRHQQAPHFTLRTATRLEDDLKVEAFRRKEESGASTRSVARRCSRGRKPRPAAAAQAA
jgi:hypothetical protein